MKKLFLFYILTLFLYSYTIKVVSNKNIKIFNLNSISKKYWVKITKKAPFDTKAHIYIGITLKNFLKSIHQKTNKLTFIAYDYYKVTFNKDDIQKPYILFVFLEDNKPIPFLKRGPAKIIYLKKDNKKNYIFKSIFLIKEVIIER